MDIISYARQCVTDEDIIAVTDVLKSDWLTQGPMLERFEQTVADYCGVRYAVAVNSATSALHIACIAAGLGKGDLLWTSPNTFVASANCALYCGASVDFVDIDAQTYNMSPEFFDKKLEVAATHGKLPRIIIPVHFAGQSCEMEKLAALANKHGISLIEDASHAIGGHYQGKPIGSCQYSDMTIFSFHAVKIVTTGEGGMVVTNRKDLYDKLILLRSHGITRNPDAMQEASQGPWYYEQIELGFNYRMTDIQAALGISQLQKINTFISRRHFLAARYDERLQGLPVLLPWQHPDTYSAFHLYTIQLKTGEIEKTRLQIFEELRSRGIGVNLHYIPVHTQPYYKKLGFVDNDFPTAMEYYKRAITLPLYPGLTERQQDIVVHALREIIYE